MKDKFRCKCPITSALDIVGDKWTLVIIKQMLMEGKKTFKGFFESDESIASNILSSRLKMLEEYRIITKVNMLNNKKSSIYILTEKGLNLTPTLLELTLWSEENLTQFHPKLHRDDRIESARKNKKEFIHALVTNYKENNWSSLNV